MERVALKAAKILSYKIAIPLFKGIYQRAKCFSKMYLKLKQLNLIKLSKDKEIISKSKLEKKQSWRPHSSSTGCIAPLNRGTILAT